MTVLDKYDQIVAVITHPGGLPDFDAMDYLLSPRVVRRLMFFIELCKMPEFQRSAGARPARNLAEAYRPEGIP